MADQKEKPNPESAAPSELPNDREQGLAMQFDDPGIAAMLPSLGQSEETPSDPSALVAEVAEAVHDLVSGLDQATAVLADADALSPLPEFELGHDLAEASQAPALFLEGAEAANAGAVARLEVAERMFELLLAEKTFDDLSEAILASLVRATAGTAGSILELDHERNEFFFRAVQGGGDPEKVKAFRMPVTGGIVGHVAESGQSMLLNDLDQDETHDRVVSTSSGFEPRNILAVPILITGRLYGVLEIFNKVGGASFDKSDLLIAEDGARMAAKVLEVRFLMAELLRRVR